jgi:hypothetical protein
MRKKTARHTPDSPKASPNQPSGLIAKGQKPGESVQEECVLDNRSHRTIIGRRMRSRSFDGQRVEVRLASRVLNTMTLLGMPDSYRVE